MNRTISRGLAGVTLLAAAFAAQANPTVETNGVITSKDGRMLYTFSKDKPGASNCHDACLAAWPAFAVANPALGGGDFSIVARTDGTTQWAYKGMPLYFYAGDAKAGDMKGDKLNGVWHVVKPGSKRFTSTSDY